MKIMLDNSEKVIREKSKRFEIDFWQLRTPLTRHRISDRPYGLDNGCFCGHLSKSWARLVSEAKENRPIFVCAPDVVGSAIRTLELFNQFEGTLNGLPIALVLQDGVENFNIPWSKISSVFIGGSDNFKASQEARQAAIAAKILGKWVHVGRVNTASRARQWARLADSIDGSGISKYDHMLEAVVLEIKGVIPQYSLDIV